MIREDIPLYKLDLEGNSPYNKVDREHMFRREVKNNNIVIPSKAPFYQKSFKMYDKTGKLLTKDVDYEFYGIMGKLTQFTAKPVGLFVRILNEDLLEWQVDYQVVGNFNKITNEILNMLHSIYEDDRYVIYENIQNKPLWFVPEIHQHDLAYDVYAFTDLVRELNRIAVIQATQSQAKDVMLQVLQDQLSVYIAGYKKVVMDLLNSHIGNLHDAHGVTKKELGLPLVDNIPAATLAETLEGLRDDLTVTPYNALLAVKAAAGRNERLYPAGSLPLLRYGSDTFIPPTISGSFEGLGGLTRRTGAIVETDGTLLILGHRNNGKIRGLYFTRCINWKSQTPNYDFTSYMYQHPTATAEGATLDYVINGSNQYIMVVGDSKKNIWYWCETHGTFNPARHILKRISGDWVTKDMGTMSNTDFNQLPWDKANVLADANYKESWCIQQTYQLPDFKQRRPGYLPQYTTPALNWIGNAGCSFNIFTRMSNVCRRALIHYTHPYHGKNWTDDFWTPWEPVTVVVDGVLMVKAATAIYSKPQVRDNIYRGVHTFWLGNGSPNSFSFITYTYADILDSSGAGIGAMPAFRGTMNITYSGEKPIITIIPAPTSAKLYTIDPTNARPGVLEYSDWNKNVLIKLVPNEIDSVGSTAIGSGIIAYTDGLGNSAFPSRYAIMDMEWLSDPKAMLIPSDTPNGGKPIYSTLPGYLAVNEEYNPVGLGTLFQSQTFLCGDVDDYTKGGMIARQNTTAGSTWIFRNMNMLNANYEHVIPPQTSTFGGVAFRNYPFTPSGSKLNWRMQTYITNHMPIPGVNNKNNFKYIFGSTCSSVMFGNDPSDLSVFVAGGDDKWVKEASTKIVANQVVITPVVVINMKTAITRDLAPIFATAGLTLDEVKSTYTHMYASNSSGNWFSVFSAFCIRGANLVTASVVCQVTPQGTPVTTSGWTEYPDCWITRVSPTKSYVMERNIPYVQYIHVKFNYPGQGYSAMPFGMSYPYRGLVNGVTPDTSAFVVLMASATRYPINGGNVLATAALEIKADGTDILNMGYFPVQDWGVDMTTSAVPYYGVGDSAIGRPIFEGAATASTPYDRTGYIWNNVTGNKTVSPPVVGFSNILTPQYTVYFQKIENILLAGKMYSIPAQYIDILAQDPNPANKTYLVYLHYSAGEAKYLISDVVRPESATQSLIATVTCGPTQIDRIIPYNRFSIDGASFSTNRQGSTILASSGSVFDIGDTKTILLDSDFIP